LIADALIDMAINSRDQAYGPNAIKALQHCSYFHEETLKYIIAKITNPLANTIQDCVKKSEEKRNDGLSIDDLRRKNGLTKVEELVYALRDALGESDPRFQAIANSFADEVIACAINAINHHKAVTTAIVLAEWAADLPSYGQSRKWIMTERKKILAWDSDYVSEDDSDDGFSDSAEDLESDECDEEIEEEIDLQPPKKKTLQGFAACPTCSHRFEAHEVIEYTTFGVRCPHCNQSIVL
jgi:DNA-directed RNA polymerase subunit RPC12/RpoP/phosphopantetheine adenylyltransferase